MFKITGTKQELFNKMVEGFEKQNWRRSTTGAHCRYRDFNGNKCAIGHLISDQDYDEVYEEHTLSQLFVMRMAVVQPDLKDFLFDAQDTHDCVAKYGNLKEAMINFCRDNDLKWPEHIAK